MIDGKSKKLSFIALLAASLSTIAWAVAVASSVVSFDKRPDRLAIVPGKSRTLRRATYCSSRWFFFKRFSRCNSASASASVSFLRDSEKSSIADLWFDFIVGCVYVDEVVDGSC